MLGFMLTIFISGSEIVLDCFDDVALDVLFLFEHQLSAVDQLSLFVVGEVGGWAWGGASFGDLFGEGESGKGFNEVGKHD